MLCQTQRDQESLSKVCVANNKVIIKPQVDTAIGIHCSLLGIAFPQLLGEPLASLFRSR